MSPASDTARVEADASRPVELGVVVGGFALAGVAVLRLLLPHATDRFFDQDPASVAGPLPALGISASLFWSAILVLVSCGVLLYEARRRGVDTLLLGLSLLPVPVLWWHGWFDAVDAVRAADWMAAVVATTAAAHLARSLDGRRILLAVVFGAVVVMGVRGIYQLEVEHPQTVRYFVENREAFLEAKGWAIDSPEALIFERRLRQPEATGWIGFSNVFSGLAAGAAIGLLASLSLRRDDPDRPACPLAVRIIVGLAGVGLAVLVGINGSKGAILSAMFGVILTALLSVRPSAAAADRRSAWALVALLLGIAAVVVRGLLPEDFLGDRSLLFRWHYLQGAWAMFLAHPWLGVGPDGFQAAYASLKPMRSPETVASAHGLLADWLASLGVFALAWAAWVVRLFVRPFVNADVSPAESSAWAKPVGIGAGFVTLLVLYEQIKVLQVPSSTMLVFLLVGALLGLAVGASVWTVLDRLGSRSVRSIAIVVAAMLLLQGQIEMLFWQPGSIFVCGLLLAAASSVPIGRPVPRPIAIGVGTVLVMVLTLPMLAAAVDRVVVEGRIRAAIAPLHRVEFDPDERIAAETRRNAAEALATAATSFRHVDPTRGAIEQLLLAGSVEDIDRASGFADGWYDDRPGPASVAYRVMARRALAARTGDPAHELQALDAVRDAIAFSPYEPTRRLEEAELLARLGRCDEAETALVAAETIDGQRDLDPLVGFGPRAAARIDAVRAGCEANPSSASN